MGVYTVRNLDLDLALVRFGLLRGMRCDIWASSSSISGYSGDLRSFCTISLVYTVSRLDVDFT